MSKSEYSVYCELIVNAESEEEAKNKIKCNCQVAEFGLIYRIISCKKWSVEKLLAGCYDEEQQKINKIFELKRCQAVKCRQGS